MQQCPGDLYPTPVTTVEGSDFVVQTFAEVKPGQLFSDAGQGLSLRYAMQGGVLVKILRNTQIQIQGALLKDHPEFTHHLCRMVGDAVSGNADIATLQGVQS